MDFRAAMPCAAILVLIRLASRTVSLSPPSKRRWSRSGNSISQRVGASLRPLLVKCGLSSGGCGATRSGVPFREKSRRITDLSASVNYDSRQDLALPATVSGRIAKAIQPSRFHGLQYPEDNGETLREAGAHGPLSSAAAARLSAATSQTAGASRCPDRKLIAPHWKRPRRQNSYGNRHFSAASACDTVPYQDRLELCRARKRRLA